MPKCVQCDKYFHPDFSVIVDEFTDACKCVFCYTDKKEVTVETEEGVPSYTVTKKEAEENYIRYIKELRYSDRVANALAGKGSAQPKPKQN